MKRGHLQRRGCRGRGIAWARVPVMRAGQMVGVEYRMFARMSATGASLMESRVFPLVELASARLGARAVIAMTLRGMRAQLRWTRDQMDFEALGMVDTTPRPADVELVPGHFSANCGGGWRQDPPMLTPVVKP